MEHKHDSKSDDEEEINSEANDESIADTDTDADTSGVIDVSNLSEADSETSDIYEKGEGQQGEEGEEGQQGQQGQQGEEGEEEEEEENASVSNSGSVSEYDENDDDDNDDDDDDDDDDENHLQKFDSEAKKNYIASFHPESLSYNNEETEYMSHITRNDAGIIIDPFHKTLPFLTKYEKTRILGIRTKQLNEGAKPYVDVNPTIIDGYIIAQLELEHKKLPFIIRRPIPNGSSELWRLQDLEIIC
jgi:DNA-directed RNA polymerase I, II, and III subunit RPABC2